jgi:predicted SAM-dependent methyltransferase
MRKSSLKSAAKTALNRIGLLDSVRSLIAIPTKIEKILLSRISKKRKMTNAELFDSYAGVVDAIYPKAVEISISRISSELVQKIDDSIKSGALPECRLSHMEDRNFDHLILKVGSHSVESETKLDQNQSVLALHRLDHTSPLLAEIHSELRSIFSDRVGSPFVIVNSRMWTTKPGSEPHGPNSFHTDGFAPGYLKVMVYLSPLSIEHGYFEYHKNGEVETVVDTPAGTAVLFQNSAILHRGVPGTKYPRISMEITLLRSTVDHPQSWVGHFYGRDIHEPTIFHHAQPYCLERRNGEDIWKMAQIRSGLKVNIGSGRRTWDNWICLDELTHEGVRSIKFDPSVELPLDDASVSLFYSSHCFEHLDDGTLLKILGEMRRASRKGSLLVLKIPDYDKLLSEYQDRISSGANRKLFDYTSYGWESGVRSVVHTWKDRIEDTIENRLAMMFCGYWNKAYGDHFTAKVQASANAYHGPPRLAPEALKEILSLNSPKMVAKRLAAVAKADPEFCRFNHQNAWSRPELAEFLRDNGFEVYSTNSTLIVQRFRNEIPDIASMQTFSAYFLAQKL